MTRLRLLPLLIFLATAALALGACGKEGPVLHGHNEGSYLDVGPVKYQVQISRVLNPADREDAAYLVGAPQGTTPKKGSAWFAVFMRAQNESDDPQQLAETYVIRDSSGNEFKPVELSEDNVFALRPIELPGREVYPLLDSAPAENTIQGSLVLFEIPEEDFDNRPLELSISSSAVPGVEAAVDLDV